RRRGRANMKRGLLRTARRSELKPTGSAGALPFIGPTGPRPSCCSGCMPGWAHRLPVRSWAVGCAWLDSLGDMHDALAPARLRPPFGAASTFGSARAVVVVALDSTAASPHQLSTDAAAVRNYPPRRDATAHALVAHTAAVDPGRTCHHRSGGTVVESAGGYLDREGAARALDR